LRVRIGVGRLASAATAAAAEGEHRHARDLAARGGPAGPLLQRLEGLRDLAPCGDDAGVEEAVLLRRLSHQVLEHLAHARVALGDLEALDHPLRPP
jgi:hypothetical protein